MTALRDFLSLTRPRQWPILSVQLAVGILCAPGLALLIGRGEAPAAAPLIRAWLAWVVCLNGGTLAFNSAYDRDTAAVAYLRRPPPPPSGTAGVALALMLLGVPLGWSVAPLFGIVVSGCVVLSILYSHPATRWKGVPGLDLGVNVVGYGFGTTLAGLAAGGAAAGGAAVPDPAGWWLAVGFGLLFGSFYPMTQIYQVADDRDRGDRTLTVVLGPAKALTLAAALGACAGTALLFWARGATAVAAPPGIAVGLWCLGTLIWRGRAEGMSASGNERGMHLALAAWALVDAAVLAGRYLG